jgi:hypothetical protein
VRHLAQTWGMQPATQLDLQTVLQWGFLLESLLGLRSVWPWETLWASPRVQQLAMPSVTLLVPRLAQPWDAESTCPRTA